MTATPMSSMPAETTAASHAAISGVTRRDLTPEQEGYEECDDGNDVLGDGCSPTCQTERCGNGRVDEGEACDDGNENDGDGCTSSCRLARCGDGILRVGEEQCDDGNNNDNDACTSDCAVARCGTVTSGRIVRFCDDGNRDDTDGCTNRCEAEAARMASPACRRTRRGRTRL